MTSSTASTESMTSMADAGPGVEAADRPSPTTVLAASGPVTEAAGMSGPQATSSIAPQADRTDDPRVDAKASDALVVTESPSDSQPAGRLDDEGKADDDIRTSVEARTGKSFEDLVIGLGRGPVEMSPRDLESTLRENGKIRTPVEDHTKQPVLDNVIVPHPHQQDRFVTEGREGDPDRIEAAQRAGQKAVNDTIGSNLVKALIGGAKGQTAPLGEGSRSRIDSVKPLPDDPPGYRLP